MDFFCLTTVTRGAERVDSEIPLPIPTTGENLKTLLKVL